MNASSSITISGPSNTILSSCPIPPSSLPTINNTATSSQHREQEPTSLSNVEEEQPIPPRDTSSSSSQIQTTEAIGDTLSMESAPTKSNPSVMVKMNNQVSATQCSNCGTTTTPLWRRAPNGDTICNACGLYLKARHTYRPTTMKRNTQPKKTQQQQHGDASNTNDSEGGGLVSGTCPGGGKCNGTGGSSSCAGCPAFNQHQVHRHTTLMCANCRTTTTPLWRRDGDGNTICNACGLYYKLHNVHRPVSMKRSVIKRRKRLIVVAADGGNGSSVDGNTSDGEEFDQLEHDDDEEHQLQLQQQRQQKEDQHQPEDTKKPRKPYRKRVKHQAIDALGKNKRNRTTEGTTSVHQHSPVSSVPAIEDYIVPKRTIFPHGSATAMPSFSAPVSPSSLASSTVSSSSSFPSPSSASSTPSLPVLMQTDSRQQQQQQQYSSTTSRLPPSIRNDDNTSSSLSLPPISSERRSAQLNSFYRDNRPTTTTSASPSSLPPFSLPPLRPTVAQNTDASSPPSIHHPSPLHPNTATANRNNNNNSITSSSPDPTSSSAFLSTIPASNGFTTTNNDYHADFYRQQQQQQSDPEFMELEDLDEALKSLNSLRRKVQPQHIRALAQLSKPLWDMVSKAQSIVHGTGALSQP